MVVLKGTQSSKGVKKKKKKAFCESKGHKLGRLQVILLSV